MTLAGGVQRAHLWAGLVLAVQIVLWALSGAVMVWLGPDQVSGENAVLSAPPPELEARNYASPGGVIAQSDGALSVELRTFRGRPVYEVTAVAGGALFDAQTGEKLSPIDEATARQVAASDYVGEGEIVSVRLLDGPPPEYRGEAPVWRVDIDDRVHTRLYISPDTGEVIARRNDAWRLYDVFRMLHMMDYGARGNVHNPALKAFSVAALLFAFSGLAMLARKESRSLMAQDLAYIGRALSGRAGKNVRR